MTKPCYTAQERRTNTNTLLAAMEDLSLLESSIGVIKTMEERWSEAMVVRKQISKLEERQDDLMEEANELGDAILLELDLYSSMSSKIDERKAEIKVLEARIRELQEKEETMRSETQTLKQLFQELSKQLRVFEKSEEAQVGVSVSIEVEVQHKNDIQLALERIIFKVKNLSQGGS
jgi:chromosome segregation ATPase